jgi:purine-nucleoside phosphorylase
MAPDTTSITSFGLTLEAIRSKLPEKLQNPQIGIICGSGLSGLVDALREVEIIQYENIPGFGRSTGELIVPLLQGFQDKHNVTSSSGS